ncbi:MAG: nucleotidyltransferase domain-containing protein, partial [Desulfomicrobium sp.]|nr:nucleotidyltransferase domain-containing protein [Desulfomicrobium sp.]
MATNQVMNTASRESQRHDASGGKFAAKSPGIFLNREAVDAFCLKWGVSELALFGSVLREDFRPESDVDVL